MEHQGTVAIDTPRLLLRPFTLSDVEPAFRNWTSDDKVTEFLTWPPHSDPSVTKEVVADWISNYKRKDFYQWAIELKEIHEPVGSISVTEIDEKTESLHIGYCIGRKWWNRGITTEAFRAVLVFLFEKVHAGRVEAQHDPKNPGSGRVMEKCGLTKEGILRRADRNNRGIVAAAVYSVLSEEYFHKKAGSSPSISK